MASVELHSARTMALDPSAAAEDLANQLGAVMPKLVVLFASHDRDQLALNRALRERLPRTTRLVGATTAGEIDNQGIHRGSALLAALTGDFDVGLGLGRGLTADAVKAGSAAVSQAVSELGVTKANLDQNEFVGIVMDDAFKSKKEELLLGMLEENAGLVLVGGGASDHEMDPAKQTAMIHVDGEVTSDAAFIALFRTTAPWAALRSHWYQPTGKTFRITKVDDSCMCALEIDGKPAAERFAELAGVSVDELDFLKPTGFSTNSAAMRVGREYFMRSPYMVEGKAIRFVNLLEEKGQMELMKAGDPVVSTRQFFEEELPKRVRSPKAALFFNCGARVWIAHGTGIFPSLSDTFRFAPPCAGLTVQFEIYCGFNINSTLTSLVFGSDV
jgi:hypothetical protein